MSVFYGDETKARVCLPCDVASDSYSEGSGEDGEEEEEGNEEEDEADEEDKILWFGGTDVDYQPATCEDGYEDTIINSTPGPTTSDTNTNTDPSSPPSTDTTTTTGEDNDTASDSSDNSDNSDSESDTAGPTPEHDDPDPICIAAHLLSHLPSEALIFSEHRRAAVLCDGSGRHSCATPGHMVVYEPHGAMMMSTYCARFAPSGCEKRVMLVNSPRMRRRVRVVSRGVGMKEEGSGSGNRLEFTALAARHGTKVEERVLALVVRMWA